MTRARIPEQPDGTGPREPAPSDRLRLAVLDDQRLFADALVARLRSEPDLDVVGVARSCTELLVVLDHHPVDVVLLEVDLSAEDALASSRELVDRTPQVRLVAVTRSQDERRVVEAVRAGVLGWVPKEGSVEDLLHALRTVAAGGSWFPGTVLARLLAALVATQTPSDSDVLLASLTQREREILQCLVEGLSRAETAYRLDLSTNTVRTHVQHVLHKLGVHSSLSAVALARRAGLAGEHPVRRDQTSR